MNRILGIKAVIALWHNTGLAIDFGAAVAAWDGASPARRHRFMRAFEALVAG
jgi:hypothetical protein